MSTSASGPEPAVVLSQPSGDALLELERRARRQGSGLGADSLKGTWRLETVWPKGQGRPGALASACLRALTATLTISGREPPGGDTAPAADPAALTLMNSVRLGGLELRFSGPGRLQGRRPLLLFHFERVRLVAGATVLLNRSMKAPEARRQPFFALIAIGPERAWLAARGRSGGVALWLRR